MDEITKALTQLLENNSLVTRDYPEGGFATVTSKVAFVKYNTGDCIWFVVVNGTYKVDRIETHNDLVFKA